MKCGDIVFVSGEVYMGGGRWVRAASTGRVEKVLTKTVHVCLDLVDGCSNLVVSVRKQNCKLEGYNAAKSSATV
jgi:hypothetical protein